ncbi:MAG: penicillin acylase family protein [Sciscionella sp.]
MPRTRRAFTVTAAMVAFATGAALAVATPASAGSTQPRSAPMDYCQGQCDDILPPGENGNATLADILGNKLLGTRPPHTDDQLQPYADLVNGYTGLTNDKLGEFFNDASFGVPSGQVEKTYRPRSDVTVVRDKHGIPHITGTTRAGTEFGAGYVAAQDRLWMMDVFRHVGRGELSGFAGGAQGNRDLEQSFWRVAPYTEADLQAQADRIANSGPRGAQVQGDLDAYLAGLNTYIDQAYRGRYFPGEYDLTGHINPITNAGKIHHFSETDLLAIAGVVGALFGSGGGGEVASALVKEAAEARYGAALGDKVWQSFREANDPEAVLTVHNGEKFPYSASPANPRGVAMPDPGSVTAQQLVYDPTGSAAAAPQSAAAKHRSANAALPRGASPLLKKSAGSLDNGVLPGNLLTAKHGMSNALVVSGKYTDSGHPIAVFGPQTGYFAPQLLMLEELQGPGISARGAAFAGLNLYVELGRGQDYSWSATSAGQDVTDTYAVSLCNTDGTPASKDSMGYTYHGNCLPMQPLEVDDSWSPTIADGTAKGSYKLITYRTKYGLVQSRATVGGKPVAYTSLRDSYMHEADSVIGFSELNDPGFVHSPETFQRAVSDINYTFNWFYVDSRHTAYYNSGNNPVRAAGIDPNLPIWAQPGNEWQGWNPDDNTADYTSFESHPNSIDQDYYISWNNKQALDYTSAGFGDGSVHRANLLDDRVKALVRGAKGAQGRKVTRAALTSAMEDAAITDLRGEDVLPDMLRVIEGATVSDPRLAQVVSQLKVWSSHGTKLKETSPGSQKYADSQAIQTFDAWWPLLAQAEFQPGMGDGLFTAMLGVLQINESPSGGQTGPTAGSGDVSESQPHKGSSFLSGWWSYVDKDLRAVLGDHVAGALPRRYCGGGDLAQCREVLLNTLKQAAAEPASQVYPGDANCAAGDQWCADTIIQRPLGGVTDPKITWQNRPTYQQVVQFPAHR